MVQDNDEHTQYWLGWLLDPLVDLEVFTCLTSQTVIYYMYSEYTNYYTKEERI